MQMPPGYFAMKNGFKIYKVHMSLDVRPIVFGLDQSCDNQNIKIF